MLITMWQNDNTIEDVPTVKAKAAFMLDGKPIIMMKISDLKEKHKSGQPVKLIELWDCPTRKWQKLLNSTFFYGTMENAKLRCLRMLEEILDLVLEKDPAAMYAENWKFPVNFCLQDPNRPTFTKMLNQCKREGWVSKELTLTA